MLCIILIFTMIIVTITAMVLGCFRNKQCLYVLFLGLNIYGSNYLIFCWHIHYGLGSVAESHVDSTIADNLYVVGGSIGIPITGSKIKNHYRVYISMNVSQFLLIAF